MAFSHGRNMVVTLDSGTTTDVDITAYITDVSLSDDVNMADVTTAGQDANVYLEGLANASLSLSGKFDTAGTLVVTSIKQTGASKTINWSPAGTTAGNLLVSGECFLASHGISASVSDANSWSATLQVSGDLTYGTN